MRHVFLSCLLIATPLSVAPMAPTLAQEAAKPVDAKANWRTHRPAGAGFSVLMPAEPKLQVDPIAEGPGSPGTNHLASVMAGGGLWSAGWADYSPDFKFSVQEELEANRDNFVKGVKGTLTSSKAITLAGSPGMEFTGTMGVGFPFRSRVYIRGGKPYQIVSVKARDWLTEGEIERFLNSFKWD